MNVCSCCAGVRSYLEVTCTLGTACNTTFFANLVCVCNPSGTGTFTAWYVACYTGFDNADDVLDDTILDSGDILNSTLDTCDIVPSADDADDADDVDDVLDTDSGSFCPCDTTNSSDGGDTHFLSTCNPGIIRFSSLYFIHSFLSLSCSISILSISFWNFCSSNLSCVACCTGFDDADDVLDTNTGNGNGDTHDEFNVGVPCPCDTTNGLVFGCPFCSFLTYLLVFFVSFISRSCNSSGGNCDTAFCNFSLCISCCIFLFLICSSIF